jgi:hypothetical protein
LCAELYNANCKKKRPRVDSSKMPACGACRSNVRARLRYPPKDGIDDGRAHSRDQSDRDPLHASRQGTLRRGFSTSYALPQAGIAIMPARRCVRPRVVGPRTPLSPLYGPKVVAALSFCWYMSVNQTEARAGVSAFFRRVRQRKPTNGHTRRPDADLSNSALQTHPWRVPRE